MKPTTEQLAALERLRQHQRWAERGEGSSPYPLGEWHISNADRRIIVDAYSAEHPVGETSALATHAATIERLERDRDRLREILLDGRQDGWLHDVIDHREADEAVAILNRAALRAAGEGT